MLSFEIILLSNYNVTEIVYCFAEIHFLSENDYFTFCLRISSINVVTTRHANKVRRSFVRRNVLLESKDTISLHFITKTAN